MIRALPDVFSPRLLGTYGCVTDAAGNRTHVLPHAAEGMFPFDRRR